MALFLLLMKSMDKRFKIANQAGFTLIEIMAVMVIIGVIGSIGTQKFEFLSDTSRQTALQSAAEELNARESLIWANVKLSEEGWIDDETLFPLIDTVIGDTYHWSSGPSETGGILKLDSVSKSLTRTQSTTKSAGKWQ